MPLLPPNWYDTCIALGDFGRESDSHVRKLDEFWDEARPISFGAAGTAVLPTAVDRFAGESDFIEISSFRKRILPAPLGRESRTYPTMRELRLRDITQRRDIEVFSPQIDRGFLVAQPINFKKSVFDHYSRIHHARDILDYCSLAVELGVLDRDSAAEFLDAKKFIPCGVEQGIFPRIWLVETLSGIERVSRQFLHRWGDRVKTYDDYQVRAVGFLSERLGSFILNRELEAIFGGEVPPEVHGHMTTIIDGASEYSVGTTARSKLWSKPYQFIGRWRR